MIDVKRINQLLGALREAHSVEVLNAWAEDIKTNGSDSESAVTLSEELNMSTKELVDMIDILRVLMKKQPKTYKSVVEIANDMRELA